MKKPLLVMSCMVMVLLTQAASAQEIAKWNDKQIEELSTKFFQYSAIDGKPSLALTAEPDDDQDAPAGPCDNTIVKLRRPGAALAIPGTSLILAFLDCPGWGETENDSIVVFFDRNNLDAPLCFSHLALMDKSGRYYYGVLESLEAREAEDKALYIVAILSGADGGDSWTSFVFLHIDAKCRTSILSKLYSTYSAVNCDEECGGNKMDYRFIDNNTVEVITKDITFTDDHVEKVVETKREEYHLDALYNNPQLRTFPSKTEKPAALSSSSDEVNKREKDGTTRLMWAAGEGSPKAVKALLDKGAEVDAKDNKDRTPLMSAAYRGYLEVVKLLLQRGADIKAEDKDGWTALMFAASGENLKVIGAGVKDGKAIITYGDSGGTLDVINLLIEKGLDVNAGDKDGYTSLVTAAHVGHMPVVKLLLEKGANINAKTNNGKTALSVAQAKGHADVAIFLKTHGAKE